MYIRISEEDALRLQREYEDIQMYNVIIKPIEKHESRKGGLMPWEVFNEVLRLEDELSRVKRLDRYVNSQRTILEQRYSEFAPDADSANHRVNIQKRDLKEAERSAQCVLLTLGMRLASYDDEEEFPYEDVCEQLREMALECEDLQMVTDLCYGLWNSEQDEENKGFFVPNEDVIHKKQESSALDQVKAFVALCNDRLYKEDARHEVLTKQFGTTYSDMWKWIFEDEILARCLLDPVPRMHIDYNIKLVLNIYGMMYDSDVFKIGGVQPLCELLFTYYDEKSRKWKCPSWADYMRSYNFKDYDNKYSALNDILKTHIQTIIDEARE